TMNSAEPTAIGATKCALPTTATLATSPPMTLPALPHNEFSDDPSCGFAGVARISRIWTYGATAPSEYPHRPKPTNTSPGIASPIHRHTKHSAASAIVDQSAAVAVRSAMAPPT